MQWYCIDVHDSSGHCRYLGKVYDTEEQVRKALGPYITITGNHVVIWGKPPRSIRSTKES